MPTPVDAGSSSAAARTQPVALMTSREVVESTAVWFKENWKGDEAKILQTREEEIALARKWQTAVGELGLPGGNE